MDLGEVALGPDVDGRDEGRGTAEADAYADEAKAGDALGETVRLREDKGVAVEEGEEDDVDNCEVKGKEHNDRFTERKEEGPIKGGT